MLSGQVVLCEWQPLEWSGAGGSGERGGMEVAVAGARVPRRINRRRLEVEGS